VYGDASCKMGCAEVPSSVAAVICQWASEQRKREMARETSEEKRLTEDEIARRILGPRGVPGDPDTAKMTPQQEKNIHKTGDFDGHTA
jgi:hypothetical protein